jgi:hypothetical protein
MGEDLDRLRREASTEGRGFSENYLRGLHASARGNAAAYGYSVTITASFGDLGAVVGATRVPLCTLLGSVGTLFTRVRGRRVLRTSL